jgi:membrane protein
MGTRIPSIKIETRPHGAPTSTVMASVGLRPLRGAAVLFWKDNAMGMAGMIAFFGFLAVIPMALLLLAFVGNVLGGVISAHDVQRLFHGVMPGLSKQQFLDTYWTPIRHSHATTTVLGVITLLLGSLGLHDSVDWAVNKLWHAPGGHPFWLSKARGVAVILWVTLFLLLSIGLSGLAALLASVTGVSSVIPSVIPPLGAAYILDIAVFTALYRLTPTVPVKLEAAAVGGCVGATLWGGSKVIFSWWVLNAGTYNRVYGPLAASVIVMLWLWISAMIFLFGAALSAVLQTNETTPSSTRSAVP